MSPIHIQELAGCGISFSNEPREDMVRKMIVGWMKIRVMFCSMFAKGTKKAQKWKDRKNSGAAR